MHSARSRPESARLDLRRVDLYSIDTPTVINPIDRQATLIDTPPAPLHWLAPLLCAVFMLMGNPAYGASPRIDVGPIESTLNVIPHIQFVMDANSRALTDIRAQPEHQWHHRQPPYSNNFGRSADTLWLRTTLSGLDATTQATYLRLEYPHIDKIDVYLITPDEHITHYQGGDTRPFSARPIPHRTYLFPLPATAQPLQVYMALRTEGPLVIPLEVVTERYADTYENYLYLGAGIYFGVLLIMFFYNSFIYLIVKDSAYLFYIVYIVMLGALQFLLFGFGFQYLWPESSTLSNATVLFVVALMPISAILFAITFIRLRAVGSRIDNIMVNCLLGCFVVLTLGGFFVPYSIIMSISHIVSLITVLLGFYMGLKYWYLGIKSARMFTLAWFVYMIFLCWYLLHITALVPANPLGHYAIAIGSALEITFLSFAFADKMNEEKELRIKAQIEVLNVQIALNKDLDKKVRARTEDLEGANERLKAISITDELTQLHNRRHFEQVFGTEYQRAFREKHPIAVLMVDVDHFKSVNDTHGHPFGDLCLVEVANCISDKIRRPPDIAARYGGEEFIVILPNTPLAGAQIVAENIRQHIEETTVSDGYMSQNMTASIGLAVETPSQQTGKDTLLKLADTMLYSAKKSGRNVVCSQGL